MESVIMLQILQIINICNTFRGKYNTLFQYNICEMSVYLHCLYSLRSKREEKFEVLKRICLGVEATFKLYGKVSM